MARFWNNKLVLISGAGSGIGKSLAHLLASHGAKLILTDIHSDNLNKTSAELAQSVVISKVADVSQKQDWLMLAQEIDTQFGYLDVLVNNAGMSPFGYFDETSEELFNKVMSINFNGVVMGCREMLPLLEKSQRGMIANVASIFGIVAVPMMSSYHASKFAVRGFSEALRQDLKYQKKNVDVVCVMPGGIKTNIAANAEMDTDYDIDFAGHFSKVARTTPEKAARVIEKGIRKNQFRILIGPDAKLVCWLQRLMPNAYSKVFNPLFGVNKIMG